MAISLLVLVSILVGPTLALPTPELYAYIPHFSVLDYIDRPRTAFRRVLPPIKVPVPRNSGLTAWYVYGVQFSSAISG